MPVGFGGAAPEKTPSSSLKSERIALSPVSDRTNAVCAAIGVKIRRSLALLPAVRRISGGRDMARGAMLVLVDVKHLF
jgi:hypothetical protein